MKKNDFLIKNAKNIKGNVLGIGNFSDKFVKKLNINKGILECNILGDKNYDNKDGKGKTKKVRISKLRSFKKKKINYLICDYEKINNYLNTFIKDSIYITCDYIYFCTNKPKKIEKLYERYDVKIKDIKCDDGYVLLIDTSCAKNNIFKEFFYRIIDFFENVFNIITDLLVS